MCCLFSTSFLTSFLLSLLADNSQMWDLWASFQAVFWLRHQTQSCLAYSCLLSSTSCCPDIRPERFLWLFCHPVDFRASTSCCPGNAPIDKQVEAMLRLSRLQPYYFTGKGENILWNSISPNFCTRTSVTGSNKHILSVWVKVDPSSSNVQLNEKSSEIKDQRQEANSSEDKWSNPVTSPSDFRLYLVFNIWSVSVYIIN